MKLRSVPIGAKFSTAKHLHCIKLPDMGLNGHHANFLVNVLVEGNEEDMYIPPTHIADYFHPDTEVTLVK